jgi:ABC-type thiamin/hydroxymethylpyrimidine transport system permease subunit
VTWKTQSPDDAVRADAEAIGQAFSRAIVARNNPRAIMMAFTATVASFIACIPNKADQETILRSFVITLQRELGFDILRRKSDDVFLRMFDQSMNRTYRVYRYVIIVGIVSAAAGFLIGFWSAY